MMEGPWFYPGEVRCLHLATVRRERRLPIPGRVRVRRGEAVEATTVLAVAEQPAGVVVVDLARPLRVPPARVARYLRRKPGASVQAGEILAARPIRLGLQTLRVRSPVDGEIVAVGGGKVLIQTGARILELRAGFPGMVAEVIPDYGAVIEMTGALIQASWSIGLDPETPWSGVVRVVGTGTEPLRARAIDPMAHGTLVVSGGWIEPSGLEQARQLQVKGLIAGSMEVSLLTMLREMPFPVILTEGFGRLPMHPALFRIFLMAQGREAFLLPSPGPMGLPGRPEILIPLPTENPPPPEPPAEIPLRPGVKVRGLREPLLGRSGTVLAIARAPMVLESGFQAWCVEIQPDGEEARLWVPVHNVEILRV